MIRGTRSAPERSPPSVATSPRCSPSSSPERRAIRGLELVEISDAALCCGSAGIFNLIEPRAAADLGDRKVQACLATEPDIIVSGNPGCLLQLGAALARVGRRVPVMHTIQLLDASLHGARGW